jgi:DNA-binding XRE family transcriptional regulator
MDRRDQEAGVTRMSDNGLGELVRLTDGERFLLDRRRRKETQIQAAKRHGVSRGIYSVVERDVFLPETLKPPKLDRIEPHERCLLYRRRANCTQAQVAKDLEYCRWWVNQMERGVAPVDILLWYWEQ